MIRFSLPLSTLLGLAIALSRPAMADDFEPLLVGSLDVTVRQDRAYASEVANKRLSDTFTQGLLRLGLLLSPEISVRSTVTFQPMKVATGSRWFKSEGAFIEELNLRWEPSDFLVYAGKFSPGFGIASKEAPGIYGTEFAADYLIKEALGAGSTYTVRTEDYGYHALGVSAFMIDNTPLAQSIINSPRYSELYNARVGRLHSYNGGVGNTEAPESVMVTLDGSNFPDAPDLRYQMGFNMLHHSGDGRLNQFGYVAGVKYLAEINDRIKFGPIAEFAAVENSGGGFLLTTTRQPYVMKQSGRYGTIGLDLRVDQWQFSVVRTLRWVIEPADGTGPNGRSSLDQIQTESIGYTFESGLGLAIAHKHVRTFDPTTATSGIIDSIGFQSSYRMTF